MRQSCPTQGQSFEDVLTPFSSEIVDIPKSDFSLKGLPDIRRSEVSTQASVRHCVQVGADMRRHRTAIRLLAVCGETLRAPSERAGNVFKGGIRSYSSKLEQRHRRNADMANIVAYICNIRNTRTVTRTGRAPTRRSSVSIPPFASNRSCPTRSD